MNQGTLRVTSTNHSLYLAADDGLHSHSSG